MSDDPGTSVNEGGILWVLTVPAIWNDSAKQFMREAAAQAGTRKNKLMIALEPEATALYCRILPVEKFVYGGHHLSPFEPGFKCIVADLGGGTVDITVLEVLDKNIFRILYHASENAWLGETTNSNFMGLLAAFFGDIVIERFRKKCESDQQDLIREFEVREEIRREDSRTSTEVCKFDTQMSLSGDSLIVDIKTV